MKLNLISGLPRSGSTLLCNILNQNPKFKATTTSILPMLCGGVSRFCSQSIEYKSKLDRNKDEAETQIKSAISGLVSGWNSVYEKETVFDKSRAWLYNFMMIQQVFPDAKMIVTIRDLRNVFSSIEKQNRKTAIFDDSDHPNKKTLSSRYSTMFSTDGIIGSPIAGIRDIIDRKPSGVIFIQYESLVSEPETIMRALYKHIGNDYFEHDFKNVQNTAEDPDGHYLNKYPHKGCGEVKPGDEKEWEKFIPYEMAKEIMTRFEFFNRTFGYF